jgi:hypothetical protein
MNKQVTYLFYILQRVRISLIKVIHKEGQPFFKFTNFIFELLIFKLDNLEFMFLFTFFGGVLERGDEHVLIDRTSANAHFRVRNLSWVVSLRI